MSSDGRTPASALVDRGDHVRRPAGGVSGHLPGERWFACAILERSPENTAVKRTGSLADVLRDGLGAFQLCHAGEPLDEPTRVMVGRSLDQCIRAVQDYLGGDHPGVKAITTAPGIEYWPAGATVAVCYAVSDQPVTGPMGLG